MKEAFEKWWATHQDGVGYVAQEHTKPMVPSCERNLRILHCCPETNGKGGRR